MTLVERHKELALLQGKFEEAVHGSGRVVMITGMVASGKTELLDTFASRAVSTGAMFLGAAGSHTEQDLPLGVFGQLFSSAGVDPAVIDRIMAGGQRVPGGRHGEARTERTLVEVLRAVCATVLELARQQPVMIGIDDTHLCDPLSRKSILYLVRRMRTARLFLVLNEVVSPHPADPMFHAELMSQPHCSRLSLSPLSRRGVAQLLQEHVGAELADQLAAEAHEVTGGNPLLVHAVGMDQSAAVEHAAPGFSDELVVGQAFHQAVVNYLYRCPPEHRMVARAVAVLGAAATPALISRLMGVDASSAERSLTALRLGGMVGDGTLRHPDARHAILGDIHSEENSDLHRRAAALLHADSAPAMVVAQHLLTADVFGFAWASSVLRTAGEDALEIGDSAFAAECLKLAHQRCSDETERARIKAVLARAEWREDPLVATRHFDEISEAIRLGRLTGRQALMTIRWIFWYGRTEQAVEALQRITEDSDGNDPELAADLRFTRQWATYLYPPLQLEQLTTQGPAPEAPGGPACPELQAAAVLYAVLRRGVTEATVVRVEQVLQRTVLDDSTLESLVTAIVALIYSDELDKASLWYTRLSAQAAARQAPTWQAILSALQAAVALRRGELGAAMKGVRVAFSHVPPTGWGIALGLPLSTMLMAATAAGDYEEAARQLDQPIPESMFSSTFGLPYLHARGTFYLVTDRPHAALEDFQACGDLMSAWGIDGPSLVPWRTEAAQALLRLGRRGAARDLVEAQLRMLGPEPSRARGITLRIRAATITGPERLAVVAEAVDILRSRGEQLELARALADMSRIQRELGLLYEARETVGRAWRVARECQAEALCDSLLPALTEGDHQPGDACPLGDAAPLGEEDQAEDDPWGLSDAERRVAALAAQGRTNREIAQALFVTVSTVEQHLTRVYRKLKVRRRTDLFSRLTWTDGEPLT